MNTDEPTVAPLVATSSRQVSPPYRVAVDELIAQLGTSRARGLSQTEAQKRLRRHGPNELPAPRPVPEWMKFLRQFADPLIILLLFATVISLTAWLIEGAHGIPYETLTIVAIVIFNSVLGYLQERHALGEIVTGLIYVDSTGEELHRYLNTVETPLNQLGVAELCPGSEALEALNDSLRRGY